MTCLDGKKHVSLHMDDTLERHAQDSSYCILDYFSHPLKALRQFDKVYLKSSFCHKSKISTMKPCSRPSDQNKDRIRSNEAPNDTFSHLEKHHVFHDDGIEKQQFSTSTRTLQTSKTPDTPPFSSIHDDAECNKRQNITNFIEKYDTVAHRSGASHHYCGTLGQRIFHTNDTSHYKTTKFDFLKSLDPKKCLIKSDESLNNLQRRTNLLSDFDSMDKDIGCMRTSPEYNSTKDSHKFCSWGIIRIGYILSSFRSRGEYASTRTRKHITIFRKWTFFLLFSLLLMHADSKRVLGNSILLSPGQICMRPRYLSGKQHEICRNNSDILKYITEAVIMGSYHCQKEFQLNRWNCSSSPKNYYSKLLQQDIRETAFITALTSAAVTYRLTMACTKGDVANCGCLDRDNHISSYDLLKAEAKKRHYKVNETVLRRVAETFEWGGCRDQVEYGEAISTLFTENFGRKYESFDLKGKIEKHNLESGRKAVTSQMREDCQCHGITGSCTVKTCWKKLPLWSDVKNHLRNKFDSAIKVQLANDGRSLLPTRKQRLAIREYPSASKTQTDRDSASNRSPRSFQSIRHRRRRKSSKSRRRNARRHRNGFDKPFSVSDDDLVYSQESPNFCKKVRRHGTLGTSGRRCVPNVNGAGSCGYLCCGRSYSQRTENVTYRCNCVIQQSTGRLTCQNCTKEEIVYYCD